MVDMNRKKFIGKLTRGLVAIGIGAKAVADESRADMREAERMMDAQPIPTSGSGSAFTKNEREAFNSILKSFEDSMVFSPQGYSDSKFYPTKKNSDGTYSIVRPDPSQGNLMEESRW